MTEEQICAASERLIGELARKGVPVQDRWVLALEIIKISEISKRLDGIEREIREL